MNPAQQPDDGPLAGDGADKLLAHLRATLQQSGLSYAEPPRRVTGGNETYIYDLRLRGGTEEVSRPLILRAYRKGYARPDQARFEATVQNTIAALGYPAARVLVIEPQSAVLGTPFIVMGRLPGQNILQGIGEPDAEGHMRFGGGAGLLRSYRLLWDIPRVCAQAQLLLHALDPGALFHAIERAGLPRASITVEGRLSVLRLIIDEHGLVGLRDACFWLEEHMPETNHPSICHSDMQPINLLLTDGEITGVVDWSQVIVADPALDVGYTKMAFETVPLDMPSFLQWLAGPIARGVSRRYLKNYTKERNLAPEAVAYYGVLRAVFALAFGTAQRLSGSREPDVWDNPEGIRNLTTLIRSVTGIEVRLPADTRAGPPSS